MNITHLGEARFPSPIKRIVSDSIRIPEHIIFDNDSKPDNKLEFELAGPREKLFFDPSLQKPVLLPAEAFALGLTM